MSFAIPDERYEQVHKKKLVVGIADDSCACHECGQLIRLPPCYIESRIKVEELHKSFIETHVRIVKIQSQLKSVVEQFAVAARECVELTNISAYIAEVRQDVDHHAFIRTHKRLCERIWHYQERVQYELRQYAVAAAVISQTGYELVNQFQWAPGMRPLISAAEAPKDSTPPEPQKDPRPDKK